ncbi:MAG: hypothetical protein JWN40_5984 [Phycisphaerales bacterium]|nr:hypothetical protein [Phycisphaerales bacterium]
MRLGSILNCVLCTLTVAIALAGAAPPPPATDPALAAQVAAMLLKLNSEDFRIRDAASTAVEGLPAEALPLIEAALASGELSPEVSVRLDAKVSLLKRKAAATAYENSIRQELEWNRTTALTAYDQGGHTNPKWDAAAREALVLQTRPRIDLNRSPRDDARIAAALQKAIDLGCDDPFLLYLRALRSRALPGYEPRKAYEMIDHAAAGVIAGHYPAFRKMMAAARTAEAIVAIEPAPFSIATKRELAMNLDFALAEMPDAVREGAPRALMYDAAAALYSCYAVLFDNAEKGMTRVETALRAAMPKTNLPFILAADFYLARAEAVRNDLDPPSVRTEPANKAKVLAELDAKSTAAIDAALAIDPQDPVALIDKLRHLTYTQASREEFEPWFEKSMAAYPNNLRACQIKRIFLARINPGGQEATEFARQCLAGANWSSRIPLIIVDLHTGNSRFDSPEEYFARSDVWNDVQAAEEGYLKLYPRALFDRTNYAMVACYARRWDIAKAQFDLLGEDGVHSVFRGKQTYDYYRRKAELLAAAAPK